MLAMPAFRSKPARHLSISAEMVVQQSMAEKDNSLCVCADENAATAVKAGAMNAVLAAMRTHADKAGVLEQACWALHNMCGDNGAFSGRWGSLCHDALASSACDGVCFCRRTRSVGWKGWRH